VTFFDDFEGNALNSSAWNVSDHDSTISEYDGHDALFVKERVSVANSNLIIETILEPQVYNGVSYNMTSGWVDTKGLVSQYQGRFEASMKMPDAGAQGAWPAWWLLPSEACWPVSGEVSVRDPLRLCMRLQTDS
jgi:beta-glucanase (GH16 family)